MDATKLTNPPSPNVQAVEPDDEYKELFDYNTAIITLKKLISDWASEITNTENRRVERDVEFDVETLRRKGELDPDETVIPRRVINSNINREMPTSIAYIKQSRRIVTFSCIDQPGTDTQKLESEYTRGMRYEEWEVPHYKVLDGSKTHGWDAVEVLFDETKPLHVAVEHIGHDRLIFARDALDLQSCDRVIRWYSASTLQLRRLAGEFSFDPTVVKAILDKHKSKEKSQEMLNLYKGYCKYNGQVYVKWFMTDGEATNWLLAPKPFFNGRQKLEAVPQEPTVLVSPDGITPLVVQQPPKIVPVDVPEDKYPIFLLPYNETEKSKIFDHKGRVFYDGPDQEAQTSILSAFVTGLNRSINIYGSPKVDSDESASVKQLDIDLTPGTILSKPMDFFSLPAPSAQILPAMNYLKSANAEEAGQIDFATQNRKDSGKTATEINEASRQQDLLKSVDVTMYSTFIRKTYGYAWLIVQSQALLGKVPLLLVQTGPGQWTNNIQLIGLLYDIRAAGDVDVLERQEKIQSMMMDWPVIQNTPLRDEFLMDLMKLKYPDDGDRYSKTLAMGDVKRNLIAAMGQMLQAMVSPEDVKMLPPETQQKLQQIQQQAQTVLATPNV